MCLAGNALSYVFNHLSALFRQKRGPTRRRHAQPGGIPRFSDLPGETRGAPVIVPNADRINLTTLIDLVWAYAHQVADETRPAQRGHLGISPD